MDTVQNVANDLSEQAALDAVAAKIKADKLLKYQQEVWIDYNAVGGLITDDDFNLKPLKVGELADQLGIHRNTLSRWSRDIPNFWERVKARRMELGGQKRLQKVLNGLYMRAARGDAEQVKIYLGVFDSWQPPAQKHEVTVGGLGDLVNMARKKQIIEGEVVDGN
jgi:hypothetical protein